MLDQSDIKQIGGLLQANTKNLKNEILIGVGEMLEQQILPQLDDIRATIVDKPYLDDKLADLKGDLVVKVRKENEKMDFIVGLLRTKGIFTDDDVRRIKQEFQIFPSA